MTEKLYDLDSYIKEFTATVLECEEIEGGYKILLDKTAFFPEGGGQPSDIGFLDDIEVFDVKEKGDKIYHYTDKPFEKDKEVKGKINFERRFDFMQQHSAEHIASGIANKLFGCENVGFHLSEDIVTFDFDKMLSREQINEIEILCNKAVFENNSIKAYYPEKEELEKLEYRSKKELDGAIRIVEIENADICACCAPHVNKTGEIGLIKLLGTEKLRGGIRIELKAGNRALKDYNERYEETRKIGEMLAVKYNETAEAVERLNKTLSEQKAQITDLKRRILEMRAESFNPETDKTAEFLENADMKELQAYADKLYKKAGGIRAVFSLKAEGEYSFVICGEPNELNEFFADFKSKFTVKGGGRNGMVQGSVCGAEEDILKFFNI
ncbi:MAG: hypothetical protein IKT38_08090 [Clostridia bacterium]|nr:hypothetical protein [Clostridia bacterium]